MRSKEVRQVELGSLDVEDGLKLSHASGWNQTEDDWRLMLQYGVGLGFRDASEELVASIVTLPYGAVAWIAMLLTREDYRGLGLGTRLFNLALEDARSRDLVVALDATPQGQQIYERYGFRKVMTFRRMERYDGGSLGPAPANSEDDYPVTRAAELDAAATGWDRRWLLEALAHSGRATFFSVSGSRQCLDSLAVVRSGRIASQLGPVYADNSGTAIRLTLQAMRSTGGGPLFLDARDGRSEYMDWLHSNGFREQRMFTRMVNTTNVPPSKAELYYAMTGPEFG